MSGRQEKKTRKLIKKFTPEAAKAELKRVHYKLSVHRRNTFICTVLACLIGVVIGYLVK